MANEKLTALTATTTPAADDELYIVQDTATTPVSKKIAYSDLVPVVPEQDIVGTAIYDATLTGTENLDLSTFTALYGILTGNTTITVTNTPASGESFVRSLKIVSTATESLTLPVGWNVTGTYSADTTVNDIQIEFSNFPTVGLIVKAYINQFS